MSPKRTRKQPANLAATKSGRKPTGYSRVLADLKEAIAESRRRALMTVNRELVLLYWHIGSVIVRQQERAKWGDAVVEQLAADLRAEFPDMKGLSSANIWRMRQLVLSCREIDEWLKADEPAGQEKVASALRETSMTEAAERLASAPRQLAGITHPDIGSSITSPALRSLITSLSWTHHTVLLGACGTPAERYFYMAMAVRERWSVRELRRQIESDLFTRYMSVREQPEKCLPAQPEAGELLPFKDHYVLEFLGLEEEHSEQELRKAILANLRDFFLEFGRDWTFVGEEYPLQVGDEAFSLDLLFFHRRLQALIVVELHPVRYISHDTLSLRLRAPKPERRTFLRRLHQRPSPTPGRTPGWRSPVNCEPPSPRAGLLRGLLVTEGRNSSREIPQERLGKKVLEKSAERLSHRVKIGRFKPEYVGKVHPVRYCWPTPVPFASERTFQPRWRGDTGVISRGKFYCAALDEQVRLPHEKPSIGLVLCKSADRVQVRLALTAAANRIGVATYQTALPDAKLIRQRLKQLPAPSPRSGTK